MRTAVRVFLFVVLLAITALPASADTGLGSSPYAARPLGSGLNIGSLAPGEDVWYTFNSADLADGPVSTAVLNMVYKPGDHDVAAYVNFRIFTFDQVDRWLQGHTDEYVGMGVFTTTDFDQVTAERLWSGAVARDETYYVHIFNNSSRTVEFHLTALGQSQVSTAGGFVGFNPGLTPDSLTSFDSEFFKPGASLEETQWLMVAAAVRGMSTEEGAAWLMMAGQLGWLPGREGSTVPPAGYYYTSPLDSPRVEPASAVEVEVVEAPEGEAEETSQAEVVPSPLELYPSVYPNEPLALHDGVNTGRLAPGGEHWYSFIRDDRDSEWYEFMPLTLFTTPADGNRSHHINFYVFTGSQIQIWERGTPGDMSPMGAGQWVSRDRDPVTGERVWAGHVVDGSLYYVQVFNHSDQVVDYYLLTGDILNTELGDRVWAANPAYVHTLWQPDNYQPYYP